MSRSHVLQTKRIIASLCVFLLTPGMLVSVLSSRSAPNFTSAQIPQVATLVINEFLADPPDGLAGDANGDGIRDSADDEFIEVVNNGTSPLNVGSFTISDSTGPPAEFTFPPNKIIPPGEAAIVFGGGTPTGAFGNCTANGLVFTAGVGLSLNNTADTITIRDNLGATVDTHTYAAEANGNQSITRSPDITGSFVQHMTAPGSNGAPFSPGTRINGSAFTTTDPTITSISPEGVIAGNGPVTMTVTGNNFQDGSQVRVDGVQVTTQFLSTEMLSAEIPASVTDSPGTYAITVQNPSAVVSNPVTFTVLSQIGINEFLADPPDGLAGDANGDGTRDSAQDEFVEIVNRTGMPIDVGGFALSDADAQRFAFPPGTIIPAGEAALIFGGGNPQGEFGNTRVNGLLFTANLSLNNGGDTITIGNGGASESVTYGSGEGSANQSINRNPDTTGVAFAPHSTIAGSAGRLFSPGTRVDGSPYTVVPHITSIAPESAHQGDPPFDLTVMGTGFDAAARVFIDGEPVVTTSGGLDRLVAQVPESVLATSGPHPVRVHNGGGNRSNSVILTIIPPPPSLESVLPRFVIVGGGTFTLFLFGLNFDSGAVVLVEGTGVATSFVNSKELRATVPGSFTASLGTRRVVVRNSDGNESNAAAFEVLEPFTVIRSIAPAFVVAGGPSFSLVVKGANFNSTSTVFFDQTALASTLVSPTELAAQVPSSLISNVGVHAVSVRNDTPFPSNELVLQVVPDPPLLRSLEPPTVIEGSGDVIVTLSGEKFQSGAVVRVIEPTRRGARLDTTFISNERLQARVPGTLTQAPGSVLLAVENPDLGLSASLALKVLIRDPLVINEFLADPPEGVAGDANGDGTRSNASDEFVEILNRTAEPIDISGYKLSDTDAIRHVFPAGTVLPPFEVTVVFGGGTPTGPFGNAGENHLVFKASSGGLSLNNGGDTIRLQDAQGRIVQEIKFGAAEGGASQSINRDPDGDGATFALHTVVAQDPSRLLSPGTRAAGQTFTIRPIVRTITPTSVRVGSLEFTLTVSGGNFLPGAVVLLGNTALPTTFRSDTQLEAQVSSALVAVAGAADVRVRNPKGELSASLRLAIQDDPPRILRITPDTAGTGAENLEVAVMGERFQVGASLLVQGEPIETRFVSSTSLVGIVPSTRFAQAAELSLQVLNADGNRSNASTLTVENGPLITRLSKKKIKAGRGIFELTVGGVAFKPGIVLFVNDTAVSTTYVSEVEFTARISAEMTSQPTVLALQARHPNGGRSNTAKLKVVQ